MHAPRAPRSRESSPMCACHPSCLQLVRDRSVRFAAATPGTRGVGNDSRPCRSPGHLK
jgi:hypothetical protein